MRRPGDQPHVARSTARLAVSFAHDQPLVSQPVEVGADAVQVKLETLGKLLSRRGPAEVAEQAEQARARRLREWILRRRRNVHSKDNWCVEACPVDAIFPEDQLPEQWLISRG